MSNILCSPSTEQNVRYRKIERDKKVVINVMRRRVVFPPFLTTTYHRLEVLPGSLGTKDHKCENTSEEDTTCPTGHTGYFTTSLLSPTKDSDLVFSVIPKVK